MTQGKRLLATILSVCTLLPLHAAISAERSPNEQGAPREVNITIGSASGWIPSEKLERAALQTWERYFAHLDGGENEAAYDMLAEGLKEQYPFTQFREEQDDFRIKAGKLIHRHMLKLTWTKDSPDAPYPGIFAAIDATAQYEQIDRQCGYLILYQAPDSDQFKVSRIENNYIENSTAEFIARSKSPTELVRTWRSVSRNCPNHPLAPLPEADDSQIGYQTVAAALDALRAQKGVVFSEENNWTIAIDEAAMTVWSFAPEGYPAYPAVVKRWVTAQPKGSLMHMSILCEASKEACDDLYETFAQMNGF